MKTPIVPRRYIPSKSSKKNGWDWTMRNFVQTIVYWIWWEEIIILFSLIQMFTFTSNYSFRFNKNPGNWRMFFCVFLCIGFRWRIPLKSILLVIPNKGNDFHSIWSKTQELSKWKEMQFSKECLKTGFFGRIKQYSIIIP